MGKLVHGWCFWLEADSQVMRGTFGGVLANLWGRCMDYVLCMEVYMHFWHYHLFVWIRKARTKGIKGAWAVVKRVCLCFGLWDLYRLHGWWSLKFSVLGHGWTFEGQTRGIWVATVWGKQRVLFLNREIKQSFHRQGLWNRGSSFFLALGLSPF